jgi:cell division protein ZapA
MSTEKRPIRVSIFNQNYTLLADEPGEVEALAATVHDLMSSISSRAGTTDSTRVAVLSCLHLADRLRILERELGALQARVDTKTAQLSLMLDQVMEEGRTADD